MPLPFNSFIRIAFTSPNHEKDEARKITDILEKGEADIVHLRKPGFTLEEISKILSEIPDQWHCKIKLHDHFELLDTFSLMGVHLNSRNPYAPPGCYSISKSCHSLEEIDIQKNMDYLTLSPVYDSISKEGYKSNFDLEEIKEHLKKTKVIALGGVTPSKFDELKEAGFAGAAMLGYFWNK